MSPIPWFKIDDSFESHPKVKGIPRARRLKAVGLWTLAGSWSARQLTDGFVPSYMLDELSGSKTEANTLVEVGLWCPVDGGYVFKDWHDWQPTKAKVEAEREAAKERMRVARERKKGRGSGDVRPNESATPPNGSGEVRSTRRSVTPTRPDPTRPDPNTSAAAKAAAATMPPPRDLLDALATANLVVRWDKLTDEQMAEVYELHRAHGTSRLVKAAKENHVANSPALYASAWLPSWRALAPLRLVPGQRKTAKCEMHRMPMPCSGCAADAKTGATA